MTESALALRRLPSKADGAAIMTEVGGGWGAGQANAAATAPRRRRRRVPVCHHRSLTWACGSPSSVVAAVQRGGPRTAERDTAVTEATAAPK